MTGTKERIQVKALELFNERGIEYVGMRELAVALDMRIGNLTYYFPTKDDLVFAIASEYSESNSRIHEQNPVRTLFDFLNRNKQIFENGVRYRCLMLSMVHIMEQNQLVADNYSKVAQSRVTGLSNVVKTLQAEQQIKVENNDVEWFLLAINSLIARFWYSEAALITKRNKLHTYVNYYLKLQAHALRPYASKKGLKELDRFLQENSIK
jgi:AcrR family transcriptional regulator